MVDIAHENRIDVLRQTAQLLADENTRLHRRLLELTRELANAKGTSNAEQLALEIQRLGEQLAARTRQLFGEKSEKRKRTGSGEARDTQPQTGHGPREQAALPIVEQVHELDEADKVCTTCGGGLEPWTGQFEDADEVDVVERSFRIVRHRRQKYRCGCGGCVETAYGPDKLLAGGRYSVDFAVMVTLDKYLEHMPLARLVREMKRQGLAVSTQTLWDQLFALSRHLEPSYEALKRYVRSAPVIGADETTWRLMEKKGTSKWWVWALCREDAVVYTLKGSRSTAAAASVLEDYSGTVIADAYSAYQALRNQRVRDGKASYTLAACWAHARRKFVEADSAVADAVIEQIGRLYEIETRGRAGPPGELAALRRSASRAILDNLRLHLEELQTKTPPRSTLGTAIAYTLNLWEALSRFVDDPAIAIDNNATERAMRTVCVGRKNHYGSRSERGTKVAAIFYSLIESAKLAGVDPGAYLREAALRSIRSRGAGAVTLPHELRDLPPQPA